MELEMSEEIQIEILSPEYEAKRTIVSRIKHTVSVLLCVAVPRWWRHQMVTFSALLAICAGNSPVPVNSPHKGQWRGALMFSLICVWINGWVNSPEASDLRRYRAHYDVTVMDPSDLLAVEQTYNYPTTNNVILADMAKNKTRIQRDWWPNTTKQSTTKPFGHNKGYAVYQCFPLEAIFGDKSMATMVVSREWTWWEKSAKYWCLHIERGNTE